VVQEAQEPFETVDTAARTVAAQSAAVASLLVFLLGVLLEETPENVHYYSDQEEGD
jgi:hypothetical protein